MNTAQYGVLTLLKSAVTQQAQPLPEGFSIEEAVIQSKSHHIATAIYEGALLCGVDPAQPVMRNLFLKTCKAVQISEMQMRDVERLRQTFDENGIDYMPLKGCVLKALYPRPELRMMGDADILIRMEQYDKIRPLMQSLRFEEKYESDHELVWQSEGLFLELHKYLIPTYNEDFYAYFGEGWDRATVQSGTCYAMSAEDTMVFLFTHFAKHYRDGGIGCRHVLDLWVYLRAHPEMDEAYVAQQLQELKLLTFYRNIRKLIAHWFDGAPADETTEFISDFVFSGGSWGTTASKRTSQILRTENRSRFGFSGKLAYLWDVAFPSAGKMKERYTILKKCPFLLPLMWLWRLFYKLLFRKRSLQWHKQRVNAVSGDMVDERRQALQAVGLDSDF
ncbi:MAG: hypothetical protein E7470_00010 [Ruminococcaceae bacterium]|nr:hypothetical protein [Oscillospiraceae bacterium]